MLISLRGQMHCGQFCVIVLDHHPCPVLWWRDKKRSEIERKRDINANNDLFQSFRLKNLTNSLFGNERKYIDSFGFKVSALKRFSESNCVIHLMLYVCACLCVLPVMLQ